MQEIIIGRTKGDREKFGTLGTVLLGKQYIQMGRNVSLANSIYLDVCRAHVFFICGKRGAGKCLHGDTLITLTDGTQMPIKHLENDTRDIVCMNEKSQIQTAKKTHFYKRTVKELLHIIFSSGKEIKLTPEHPLFTKSGWKPAENLFVGGTIAAPRSKYLEKKQNKNYNEIITNSSQILLLETDIIWEEIKEIKKLEGDFTVYDLTVPQYHNFVANDIIVHNSYTMGAITEGMANLDVSVRQNLSFILLDTMGIYWTMKYPNKKDTKLLAEWGFKGQGLDVVIFTPYKYFEEYKKQGIPTDFPFSMNASELDSSDWQMTFELEPNDPISILIERIIHDLREKENNFTIDDIIAAIKVDTNAEKNAINAATNRFMTTKGWGLFAEKGMKGTGLNELALGGKVTVLDVSCYATMPGGWKIKHLIVGLVAQKLFIQRMIARKKEEHDQLKSTLHYFSDDVAKSKRKMPLVWLVIDEAHEFLPRTGSNPATEPLVTILREGRQPGISLILATQQPGKIHTDVMTQSDTVLSHRITARLDVEALGMLMQSYMKEGLDGHINNLPRKHGACVMFDDTNERMYSMQVRPRFTWHGGESPSALMEKKKGV